MDVWSFMIWVVWPNLVTQLNQFLEIEKNRVTIFFPIYFLPYSSFPSLLISLTHCQRVFHTILFYTEMEICSSVVCVFLCYFYFLSFWSGISQPVLFSWNRRGSSCSKQEQESHRWQNSGNASIFWIDSDWKAGHKHSWDHEDTQVWSSWCGSVWLHSPWVEKIQPHIQVILLLIYFF